MAAVSQVSMLLSFGRCALLYRSKLTLEGGDVNALTGAGRHSLF